MALLLPKIIAGTFVAIGVGAAIAPENLAENFGIPIEDDAGRAYVRGLGARDLTMGVLIAAFIATKNRTALATTIAVSSLFGISDFTIVTGARGFEPKKSLAIHVFGTLGLLITGALVATGDIE